jgi:hypothetical protein
MPQNCDVHSDMQEISVSHATLFGGFNKIQTSGSESTRGITKTALRYHVSILC